MSQGKRATLARSYGGARAAVARGFARRQREPARGLAVPELAASAAPAESEEPRALVAAALAQERTELGDDFAASCASFRPARAARGHPTSRSALPRDLRLARERIESVELELAPCTSTRAAAQRRSPWVPVESTASARRGYSILRCCETSASASSA